MVFLKKTAILFSVFITFFSVMAGDELSPDAKKLIKTEKLLENEKTRTKALKQLTSFAKWSKRKKHDLHYELGCEALTILASELRKEAIPSVPNFAAMEDRQSKKGKPESLAKAYKLLEGYDDFSRLTNWRYIEDKPTNTNPQLGPFLELSHCKAIDRENPQTREAFKSLNFAEQKTKGLDKCFTLFKFGEVLFDLGQNDNSNFQRSKNYLEQCLLYGNNFFKPDEASQSGKIELVVGTGKWNTLKEEISKLLFEIDFTMLELEYGLGYSLYVQMQKYYNDDEMFRAFPVSVKLKDDFPNTVYGQAGRLYWCRMLLSNDTAEEFRDKSLPSGQKELLTFIALKPLGLYRGEAWIELANFQLDYKLNTEKAAEYYNKALAWFRKVREAKDAVDLLSLPAKVQNIAKPSGNLAVLDKWYRVKYRIPGAKEVTNRNTAPWYIDEKEKECLFMVGFFHLITHEYKKAEECFQQIKGIDKDIALCVEKNIPNALWRLEAACNIQFMIFPAEENKFLKGKNKLYCAYAEFNYLIEKFDKAKEWFNRIIDNPKSSDLERAIGLIGLGACCDMTRSDSIAISEQEKQCFKQAMKLAEKTPIAGNALIRLGSFHQSSSRTFAESEKYFRNYLNKYKGGRYEEKALFRLALLYSRTKRITAGKALLAKLEKNFPESYYLPRMKEILYRKR